VSRAKDGRFTKGSRRPANAGRKKGTPNRATRAWKDFVAELVNDPESQDQLARAIGERPELLFKAAEHAVGKPRQTLEVASSASWIWEPPARADGPLAVPAGALVLPQGAHIHEGWEEEHHCYLCHENWAARVDNKNECPRCKLQPGERAPSLIFHVPESR
jgi:hypothetical protein